jgi:hypothetical protein
MNSLTRSLAASILVLGAAVPAVAHSRVFFGFNFGVPLYPPAYYYPGPAYYYPPPVVAVPSAAPAYVEQGPSPSASQGDYAWYYCPDAKAYYPYVKECPSPWQRVAPHPPGQ